MEWENAVGPVVQSDDVPSGNLMLSDFAVLGFPHTMILHLRTPEIVMRDVATEIVIEANKKGFQSMNPPEVPYILFSGHAGGKIYNVCTDHITGRGQDDRRPSPYNLLQVKENQRPLAFYQLSIEHHGVSPQMLLDHAHGVTVFGFKYEGPGELLDIIGGDHINFFGGSGNYNLENPNDRAIIVVEDARDILLQSLVRRSITEMFNRPVKDYTAYWAVNGPRKLPGNVPILLYREGDPLK
jgi:hypothetical protein